MIKKQSYFVCISQGQNKDGQTVTIVPKTLEAAGFDKEPKIIDRELPIDEFRYYEIRHLIYFYSLKSVHVKR